MGKVCMRLGTSRNTPFVLTTRSFTKPIIRRCVLQYRYFSAALDRNKLLQHVASVKQVDGGAQLSEVILGGTNVQPNRGGTRSENPMSSSTKVKRVWHALSVSARVMT